MPYVITTINECTCCTRRLPGLPGAGGAPHLCGECGGSDGRRAVATLEAEPAILLHALRGTMHGREWVDLAHAIRALPEAGGTVGPLPDGSAIEVAPISWDELRTITGPLLPHDVIDAYNAREEGKHATS